MKVWLVRGGKYGETESLGLDNGEAAIGFSEVSDIRQAGSREDIARLIRANDKAATDGNVINRSAQLYAFAHRIEKGDLIVMPLKSKSKIAIGIAGAGYQYMSERSVGKHAIKVDWRKQDIPRSSFKQDLLHSFGAFMTVCQIKRNNALSRVKTVMEGKADPGDATLEVEPSDDSQGSMSETDLTAAINDQITRYIQSHFSGHGFARLVAAILAADDYDAKVSPPGPDGGVDILAGKGFLGLDSPNLVVQVKSGSSASDVAVYRNLQGAMQSYNAELGLLVSWGGFTRAAEAEARTKHFQIRLWDQSDVLSALFRTYHRFPEEMKAELPLTRSWLLVQAESEAG